MKRKLKFDGSVASLKKANILQPLREFPFVLHRLSKELRYLGHGWYVLVGASFRDDGIADRTTRVQEILWAVNASAAAFASYCSEQYGDSGEEPAALPEIKEIVPKSSGWHYGELIKSGNSEFSESGIYGNDGRFQFKEMWFDRCRVFFLSRNDRKSELPIAISLGQRFFNRN